MNDDDDFRTQPQPVKTQRLGIVGDDWEVAADAEDQLASLCGRYGWDFGIRVECVHEATWSAEVRITRRPNSAGVPDRSLVSYAVGGPDPDHCVTRAARDVIEWALTAAIGNLDL